jgi:hypothetical protein
MTFSNEVHDFCTRFYFLPVNLILDELEIILDDELAFFFQLLTGCKLPDYSDI